MVRELTHDRDRETDRDDDSVGRRGYLTLCGTAAATGALVGFSGPGAATSRRDDDAGTDGGHTLVVAGEGGPSTYEVTVSDRMTPLAAGDTLSTTGRVGRSAEGVVAGDSRSYRFTGSITDVRVDGPVSLYVDGVRVPDDAF